MPSYKMIYFNGRGRAEPARMMFIVKGVKFEDERFEYEEWPKRKVDKAVFPIGQAPVLIVDGKTLPQSTAFCRYIARELGFYGANSLEGAWIDVVIATMVDIEVKLIDIHYGDYDDAKRAELKKAFVETTTKPHFSYLDQLMKEAGGKYFVGNKISLADIYVFNWLDMMSQGMYKTDGILDQYPALTAFCKYFCEEGPLKDYLKSRPVTEF